VLTIEKFIIEIRRFINNIKTKLLIKKDFKEKLKKISELMHTNDSSFTTEFKFKNNKYESGYTNKEGENISKLNTGNLRLTEWDIDVILNNDAYDETIRDTFGKLTSGDNEAAKKALEIFDSFSPDKKPDSGKALYYRTKGFSKLIINAYETMEKAPKWIELLERCREDAKKKARLIGSEDVKSTADATYYQRTINKGIMHIQKIMNACFKILFTLEKVDFVDKTSEVKREKMIKDAEEYAKQTKTKTDKEVEELEKIRQKMKNQYTNPNAKSSKEFSSDIKKDIENLNKTKENFSKNSQERHEELKKATDSLKKTMSGKNKQSSKDDEISRKQAKISKELDDLLKDL